MTFSITVDAHTPDGQPEWHRIHEQHLDTIRAGRAAEAALDAQQIPTSGACVDLPAAWWTSAAYVEPIRYEIGGQPFAPGTPLPAGMHHLTVEVGKVTAPRLTGTLSVAVGTSAPPPPATLITVTDGGATAVPDELTSRTVPAFPHEALTDLLEVRAAATHEALTDLTETLRPFVEKLARQSAAAFRDLHDVDDRVGIAWLIALETIEQWASPNRGPTPLTIALQRDIGKLVPRKTGCAGVPAEVALKVSKLHGGTYDVHLTAEQLAAAQLADPAREAAAARWGHTGGAVPDQRRIREWEKALAVADRLRPIRLDSTVGDDGAAMLVRCGQPGPQDLLLDGDEIDRQIRQALAGSGLAGWLYPTVVEPIREWWIGWVAAGLPTKFGPTDHLAEIHQWIFGGVPKGFRDAFRTAVEQGDSIAGWWHDRIDRGLVVRATEPVGPAPHPPLAAHLTVAEAFTGRGLDGALLDAPTVRRWWDLFCREGAAVLRRTDLAGTTQLLLAPLATDGIYDPAVIRKVERLLEDDCEPASTDVIGRRWAAAVAVASTTDLSDARRTAHRTLSGSGLGPATAVRYVARMARISGDVPDPARDPLLYQLHRWVVEPFVPDDCDPDDPDVLAAATRAARSTWRTAAGQIRPLPDVISRWAAALTADGMRRREGPAPTLDPDRAQQQTLPLVVDVPAAPRQRPAPRTVRCARPEAPVQIALYS